MFAALLSAGLMEITEYTALQYQHLQEVALQMCLQRQVKVLLLLKHTASQKPKPGT